MSLARTRPSLAVGFAGLAAFNVDEVEAAVIPASSASLARSDLLRWPSDRRSAIFRSLRRSGGVADECDRLLLTLSGRSFGSGVRRRLIFEIFEGDRALCALPGRCSLLDWR